MDSDDRQVGQVFSRREFLALLGTAGAALLAGCLPQQTEAVLTATSTTQVPTNSISLPTSTSTGSLPACIVRPELTEGPYFVDEKLDRSDIRIEPSDNSVVDGLPLVLKFMVSQVGEEACTPLAGAMVDVWHCDALGVYSDVSDPGFNTVGKKFLRGYQLTDENGIAQFTTIYPGWYQGRTVHVHFKIRSNINSAQSYEFTSQLFFDDTVSDQVYQQDPYASKGERTLRNQDDGIFQNGGSQLLLQLNPADEGYSALFDVGLQMG